MRHSPIDQYAKDSNFYLFDPRAKIIGVIFFVIMIAFLRVTQTLVLSLVFILMLNLLSKVPLIHIAKRYFLAFPFIAFPAVSMYISNSFDASISMYLRISTCVLGLILLSCTTPFFEILKGLQGLRVPKIFVVLLLFTYRYFFVLMGELHRMKLARYARGFKGGRHLFDKAGMKTISFTAGMVLVRAYERSARIYDTLVARGYDGTVRTIRPSRLGAVDIGYCLSFISISIFFVYLDWSMLT